MIQTDYINGVTVRYRYWPERISLTYGIYDPEEIDILDVDGEADWDELKDEIHRINYV